MIVVVSSFVDTVQEVGAITFYFIISLTIKHPMSRGAIMLINGGFKYVFI